MRKVLGIGNALVDVMTRLKDDSIIENLGFTRGSMNLVDNEKSAEIKKTTAEFITSMESGGSAANTIHGLAKLHIETGFIGATAEDTMGEIFKKDMKSAGVKTYLSLKDDDTGTAIAMISPDSERTFATHLGAAEKLVAKDLDIKIFRNYDILYLEGYIINNMELIETACKYAREEGLKIAIDMASFNVVEAFRNDFKYIIKNYVDIIFANEQEAEKFTGNNANEALKKMSGMCEIAVIKTGAEGSMVRNGNEMVKADAIDVECIDTTGAGDLYASGFLFGLANNAPLDKCGYLGSLLASYVIQVIGPKINTDKWPKIREEINEILE
ncbi:MAG TPA: adenosine kinase [Bacteroidales bacterium]|nr:adenosine kinase [Bacteroidales bacterium]